MNGQLASFATEVLTALSAGVPTVFHLELFLGPADAPRLRLLEVAGRIPGAEATHLWHEVHGYDLVGAALDIQMGRRPVAGPPPGGPVAGQLLVRPRMAPPCVVTAARLDVMPQYAPYHSAIPAVGHVITESDGYVDIGASFRFRGDSSQIVTAALMCTLFGFRMDCATTEFTAELPEVQRQ